MKRIALATAVTLALTATAPAFAGNQLAAGLGVDASDYTVAELIELRAAKTDNDGLRATAIKNHAKSSTDDDRTSAGHVQLANQLDVDANAYTTSDLIEMKAAMTDGDYTKVRFIKANAGADATVGTKGNDASPAKIQLANKLGVDANAYTLNELAGMLAD